MDALEFALEERPFRERECDAIAARGGTEKRLCRKKECDDDDDDDEMMMFFFFASETSIFL